MAKEAGGTDFEGKCYVFDNRLSVDVNSVNPKVISTCLNCGKVTPKMINCANPECNEHFTQCDECGSPPPLWMAAAATIANRTRASVFMMVRGIMLRFLNQ